MSAKKKHRTVNEYLQYLRGDLNGRERHDLERGLEADPFEKEAMEGLEVITPAEAEEDILAMHSRLRKRIGKRRRMAFYSAAATVASLLVIGTIFLQIHDFDPEIAEEPMLDEKSYSIPAESDETVSTGEVLDPVAPEEPITSKALTTKGPEEELTSDRIEEVTPPEVSEALIQEAEMEFDMVIADEEIVAVEAEPDVKETVPVPSAAKRAKSVSYQPTVQIQQEEQKMALSQEEYDGLVSGNVSGVVISGEDLEPLPGATVSIKGTSTGVVADMNGRFSLPVEYDSNTTVIASFVGMETQEYQVEEMQDFELVMQPDAMTLDEVVVVGQSIQRRSELTGAYSTVDLKKEEAGTDYTIAEPAGGYKAFKQYIEEDIQFPTEDSGSNRAIVVLRFTVTHSGSIEDIIALRSPGPAFTKEAERLLLEGPSWIPASNEKETREDVVRLRIIFKK